MGSRTSELVEERVTYNVSLVWRPLHFLIMYESDAHGCLGSVTIDSGGSIPSTSTSKPERVPAVCLICVKSKGLIK